MATSWKRVCSDCGSDQIEEQVLTWWDANTFELSDSDPCGSAWDTYCRGCQKNGISFEETRDDEG